MRHKSLVGGIRDDYTHVRVLDSNELRGAGVFVDEGRELVRDFEPWAPDNLGSSPSGRGVTANDKSSSCHRREGTDRSFLITRESSQSNQGTVKVWFSYEKRQTHKKKMMIWTGTMSLWRHTCQNCLTYSLAHAWSYQQTLAFLSPSLLSDAWNLQYSLGPHLLSWLSQSLFVVAFSTRTVFVQVLPQMELLPEYSWTKPRRLTRVLGMNWI